jgi:molybdenum cofactor biosynthesis enzyme
MRDPSESEGMWSIWDMAKPTEREKIVEIARILVRKVEPTA